MIQFVPTLAVTPLSVAVHSLRSSVQGRLILPEEPGYEEGRLAWSRKVDQQPAMILLAKSAQDVMKAAPSPGKRQPKRLPNACFGIVCLSLQRKQKENKKCLAQPVSSYLGYSLPCS